MRFPRNLALSALFLLAACEPRVDVDATANVPAAYSRVLVTVEEIWLSDSATAVPEDTTWQKFELDDAVTFDLVDLTAGELIRIAGDLDVPAGTYQQVRLILASRDDDLHDSAEDAGATYNNEVSWFDEEGDPQTSPLEVLNAAQGVGIEVAFEVEEEEVDSTNVLLVFDAARDLTEFRHSDAPGFLLNPTLKGFDAADVGTIRGVLNLSQLNTATRTGRPDIQVTAQRLNETLGRREIVASTAVSRTGSFVLYPLPLDEDEDEDTEFDLVIHGPAMETLVIRDVPVSDASPQDATAISLEFLSPQPASSFEVDIAQSDPLTPRGARIGFYQTLPDEDFPHLITLAPVDPLRGRFAQPVLLSRAATISYGDYDDADVRSGTPEEGAARYAVAAVSPHHGTGALSDTLLRPASTTSETATFSVPAIGIPGGAVSGTISSTVNVEDPGRYDRGVLIVTRGGAVVTATRLEEVLQQALGSAFVEVAQVPAGSAATSYARGLYYLEAWTWDSDDPEDTFERHPGSVVDLRSSAMAAGTVIIR
jgi:hypothetical protein